MALKVALLGAGRMGQLHYRTLKKMPHVQLCHIYDPFLQKSHEQIFDKKFFRYLRKGEMIEGGFVRLAEKRQLAVFNHDKFWHAMDTYQDMEEFNKMWKKNPKWKIWK